MKGFSAERTSPGLWGQRRVGCRGRNFHVACIRSSGAWKSFGFRDGLLEVRRIDDGGRDWHPFRNAAAGASWWRSRFPYPESVRHRRFQSWSASSKAAKLLFLQHGFGGLVYLLGQFNYSTPARAFVIHVGQIGEARRLGTSQTAQTVTGREAWTDFSSPGHKSAYLGVGYIIGRACDAELCRCAWLPGDCSVPLLIYILGPQLQANLPAGSEANLASSGVLFHRASDCRG